MESACSVASLAFSTSPLASSHALPFSRATLMVSSSISSTSSLRTLCSTCMRFSTGVSRQAGYARYAAATAFSASSSVHFGARAMISPVLGLYTS